MKKYSFRICLERYKNCKIKNCIKSVKIVFITATKTQLFTGYGYKSSANETEVLVFYCITNLILVQYLTLLDLKSFQHFLTINDTGI